MSVQPPLDPPPGLGEAPGEAPGAAAGGRLSPRAPTPVLDPSLLIAAVSCGTPIAHMSDSARAEAEELFHGIVTH